MVVKGTVEHIVFQNRENGYTVAEIDCNGELVTLVGKMPSLMEGQLVSASGNFVSSAKWGEQFSVSGYEALAPSSLEGIKKYLSSGLIRGVGPVTANAIVDAFGEQTLDIIEFSPLRLAEVKGISLSKAAEIGKALFELKKMQDTVIFLQEYDISTHLSVKIYGIYQNKTKEVLKTNPYRLVEDVAGIGFRTADKIAQKLGIEADSEFRIRAGLIHTLTEASERDGNTFLPRELLLSETQSLLELNFSEQPEKLESVLKEMTFDGAIREEDLDGVLCVMLSKFYTVEKGLAQKLLLLKSQVPALHLDLSAEIAEFERVNKIDFHSDQKKAITLAVNEGVCVITGGPGTGKTTIIKCIISILEKHGRQIALLAPTGRAAKRMSESCGVDASTIHRALMLDFGKSRLAESGQSFSYNENNRFPFDAVIVDEVSMVDSILAFNLVRSLKAGAKLLLVGDKNQLPSVGAGNVLADIISSELIPYCNLTQIYRQDEESRIITNAHAINNGEMPILDNSSRDFFFENRQQQQEILRTIVDMQCSRIPKFLSIEPIKIQVLAPMRNGTCGVDNLNLMIQEVLNPPSSNKAEIVVGQTTFRVGDKVMQTVNNYQLEWRRQKGRSWELGEAVFNGDIGFVTEIDFKRNIMEITFDDGRVCEYPRGEISQLTLSYATTVHKSQGSEFDVVIMPIIGGAPQILTRNLLYTGVTRAKKMVVLVGQKFHLKMMVQNNYTATRYSTLSTFLRKQNESLELLK